MPDISVTYEGNEITNMSASGTKTLLTDGKYCTDDITITYVRPSGGGTVEEKDVNFIDYDGTILYSYTAAEFADLASMPANPSHTGLTAQGWNWSLADAKTFVAAHGGLVIGQMYNTSDGKTYIYIDLPEGRTSPYLNLAVDGTLDVDWGDGSTHDTMTGSSLTTLVSVQHNYATAGEYVIAVSVTSGEFAFYATSSFMFLSKKASASTENSVYSYSVTKVLIGSKVTIGNTAFRNMLGIKAVLIPKNIESASFGTYSFYQCYSLQAIVIPNTVTAFGSGYGYTFGSCQRLRFISIPNSVTDIGEYAFSNSYALEKIYLPESVTNAMKHCFYQCYKLRSANIPTGATSIDGYMFYNNYVLTSLTIPSSVTSIADYSIAGLIGLKELHFKRSTPPQLSSSSVYWLLPTDCTIYVPTGKLNTYKTKTNYPDPNTYTYVEE